MSRFCAVCGKKIDDVRFCPACGAPVDDGKTFSEKKAEAKPPCAVTPSGEIILGADGVYRWAYDFNLLKNPTILFMIWKIFGGIGLGLFLLNFLLSMGDHNFWFEGFLELAKVFGLVILGMFALALVGYLVYAAIMGGKYCVLFEMDDKGVTHTQVPKQFKKAQVLAILLGLNAKSAGTLGTAILAGTKSSSSSEWRVVKSISCNPYARVIKVNSLLSKNQVYASKEDFAFVRDYIISHCPNAKIKGKIN